MRPMTTTRACLIAGASAVCASLAAAPATASSDVAASAASATRTPASTRAAPKSPRIRKRTQARVRIDHVRRRNILVGRSAVVTGVLQPGLKGHVVRLQRRSANGWTTVERSITRAHGAYRLSFKPKGTGTLKLRVQFPGDRGARRAHHPAGRLNVFRRARASWYSLPGNRTACGQTLTAGTLGVAHKSLPCGTKLTLRNRGRSVRVRVIDRGPFVSGREFDLTAATKRALGFGDLGTVLVTR